MKETGLSSYSAMPETDVIPPETYQHKKKAKVVLVDAVGSGKSTLISALVHKLVDTQDDCQIVRNSYASCVVRDPGTAVEFNTRYPVNITTSPTTPTTIPATKRTALEFLETELTQTYHRIPHIILFSPPQPDLILICFPLNPYQNPTAVLQELEEVIFISPPGGVFIPKHIPVLLVGCKLDLAWAENYGSERGCR
jgi:GTPase SAR1 family protein